MVRSPSPQPSPQKRGSHDATPPGRSDADSAATGLGPPSPWGEGWGEGERDRNNKFCFAWQATITLAGLLLTTCGLLAANSTKPNVLFILADDFRPDCIATLGNAHIKTPNLDSLTERGLAFTHTYTMGSMVPAACTPSRTMILTGRSLFHAPGQNYALLPKAMAAGGYE